VLDDDELRRLAEEDFFVGYFPMTGGQRRFLWGAVAVFLLAVFAAGASAAWFQRNPGLGLERYRTGETLEGVLVDRPYPMLRVLDGERVRHVLLVTGSKRVWTPPASAFGTGVALRGNLLERDGSRMLEVFGREPVTLESLERLRAVAPEGADDVTLVGEIVDSKCYFGRMRPGGGRTHRACAQLCIAGGIPPVLVTRDAEGREWHYLLASEEGGSVARAVLPYVSEPVRVRGSLSRIGDDLRIVRIDPSEIERL